MSSFFVNRPIVAIVISIIMTIVGVATYFGLPVAQFPNIVPPEIQVKTTYTGADALTVEQSVATPIEQQMSGVDNMNYMSSVNGNDGTLKLTVNFDVATEANTDQILSQMRSNQATSQLPEDVNKFGVTVQKSTSSPLIMFALYSPKGTYDSVFLANYSNINLNDEFTRVKGIASVTIFGAGQYAMRIWVKPDSLAKLGITVPEIVRAVQAQNAVNPAGTIGGEPVPKGQEFTYAVRAQGRLQTPQEFGDIVVRADPDGSMVRIKDVARIELGAQSYALAGRLNGKPAAIIALYQLPGSNAIAGADGAKKKMKELSARFPADLEYVVSLDTTLAVTEGMVEIKHTLIEALVLVILVVFIFLQGWRATLIPLLAVPVSLVGTFALFPLFGFTVNTLSLFGLVLAIGLVVDDAIVVVEAVEHHIEHGLTPKEATLKAMEEVSGPVIAIALVLTAVFLPTVFIPGITGRLYQQFAVTIAVSMLISAFNALTLSPALSAMLLKPRKKSTGLLQRFFDWFNRVFGTATDGYVTTCRFLIHRSLIAILLLGGVTVLTGMFGKRIPSAFLPEEDQGYFYAQVILPDAASLQRTDEVMRQAEKILKATPGVEYVSTVTGYNFLSGVNTTYSGIFFVTLKGWSERKAPDEQYAAILKHVNGAFSKIPGGRAFAFSPPAIPGIGTSGGVTFILQDRSGGDIAYLAENVGKFVAAARERKELASVTPMFSPAVPQIFMNVDREKVLKQGIDLKDVYQTLQTFMGGYFVNYFNRFGRQWQVFIQAEGDYRTSPQQAGLFFVKSKDGEMAPLSALMNAKSISGPEYTMRYNLYRSAQINATPVAGISSGQAMKAMEEVFREAMPSDMGFAYMGMSFQEKTAQEGVSPMAIFAVSLLFVFLILAAQYESWSLPFSVLLGTPVAVCGAFAALLVGRYENNIYAQIGLVMLIGLSAKNSILIVEFAKMKHETGLSLFDSALEGAKLRLRPILMTSFAFILGCVPLATASGAGALSRQVMGYVVIGGMLAASFIAVFLVPVLFYLVEKLTGKRPPSTPEPPSPSSSGPAVVLAFLAILGSSVVGHAGEACACGLDLLHQPLSKVEAMNLALVHNSTIRKAQKDVQAAIGVSIQTKAIIYPQVTGTAFYDARDDSLIERNVNRSIPTVDVTLPTLGNVQIGGGTLPRVNNQEWLGEITVVQTIYQGGRLLSAVRSSRLMVQRAMLDYESIVADTLLSVITSYDDVLGTAMQIGVRKESVTVLTEFLKNTRTRYSIGDVPQFDVLREEVEVANAEASLVQAIGVNTVAKQAFVELLGYDLPITASDDLNLNLTTPLQARPYPNTLPQSLTEALLNRSEIAAREKEELLRNEQIIVAKAGYKPTFQIFAAYEATSRLRTRQIDESLQGGIVGAQGAWAIFDGFLTKGRVDEAVALRGRAREATAETMRLVALQVRTAWSDLRTARAVLDAEAKNVDKAVKALSLVRERYNAGSAIEVDVLSAQTALTDARATYVGGLRDYSVARARLVRATGNLLPTAR